MSLLNSAFSLKLAVVAMFIPEVPAYAINQSSGEAVGDGYIPVPGAVTFPWNPSPRRAEAGEYRVQLPGYTVRLSQNTKRKKYSRGTERTVGLPLDVGHQGMGVM